MQVPIRAVTICVSYDDIAALTIPYNRSHFSEHWIITTPEDTRTQEIAKVNGCQQYLTREFYYKGAEFAKWRALEIALDTIGRHGWILLLDADVCWPKDATERLTKWNGHPKVGSLYGANRRMLETPSSLSDLRCNGVPPEDKWTKFYIHHNVGEWAGYTQLFHSTDPVLPKGHWHDTNWRSCGASDSFFQALWKEDKKVKLPFEVLHIGSAGDNWYGRCSPYLDNRPDHPDAAERKRKYKALWAERRKSGFDKERIE